MIIFFCLIILASTSNCPYCKENACITTELGHNSCSDCSEGVLVKVQTQSDYG